MQLLRASSINSFWASADSPEMYRMRGAQKKAAGCLEEAAQNRIIIIIIVVVMIAMVVMVVMVIFINLHLHLHQYSSSSSSSSYSTHTHFVCYSYELYNHHYGPPSPAREAALFGVFFAPRCKATINPT